MEKFIEKLPDIVAGIKSIKELIITNIVLIGQVPSPTFKESNRSRVFLDRMAELGVDECTTDSFQNPIGIIRGTNKHKPPIFVCSHIDTFFEEDIDHNYTINEHTIKGAGILDNSLGVGVLASLPEIFKTLNLSFESDIILAGVIQSIGKGNLRGIRHLLRSWSSPVRGAVCIEACELGRLNYYSDGMVRCEINCYISTEKVWEYKFRPNAILILNEVINQILMLRLPQRPRSRVIFGKITGGVKHGAIAYDAKLGFEIQSNTDSMVKEIYNNIRDIVNGIGHEYEVELKLKTISSISASKLQYNHPLVKRTVALMKSLDIKPFSENSESELSILLSHNIPAITLGVTHGKHYHSEKGYVEIEPMFKGIAQILGVIKAIDCGVCDE